MTQGIKSGMRRMIIDKMLVEKGAVSFEELVAVLKVSAPTVKRDLRYMREMLNAPIRFSSTRGGYFYDDESKPEAAGAKTKGKRDDATEGARRPKPKLWYTSEELLALANMIELLGRLGEDSESMLAKDLAPLRARALNLFTLGGMEPSELARRVRVVSREKAFREPDTFETIGVALCARRRLEMHYYNPKRDDTTVRVISPMRLVHANNRWYVDAFDHTTDKLKTFLIENVRRAEILEKSVRRMTLKAVAKELDGGYGMFRSRNIETAVIRFDKSIASYILREIWHEKQEVVPEEDGSILLKVPYASGTELVGDVLQWGDKAEILEPPKLRNEMIDAARRLCARYDRKAH